MKRQQVISWLFKPIVFILALLPLVFLVFGAIEEDLGANPIETVTDVTGNWALRFLLITLAITPLRKITGIGELLRFRRMLGLFAFFYVTLHLLTWVWLDQEFYWQDMVEDIVDRPYITVGFLAWILLVPLAITSTRGMIRRLGKRWSQLHKLSYLIAPLGVLHYLWLVKADLLLPVIYGGALILLLLYRVDWSKHRLRTEVKS